MCLAACRPFVTLQKPCTCAANLYLQAALTGPLPVAGPHSYALITHYDSPLYSLCAVLNGGVQHIWV